MKKRLSAILLFLALLLCLITGCGSRTTDPATTTEEVQITAEPASTADREQAPSVEAAAEETAVAESEASVPAHTDEIAQTDIDKSEIPDAEGFMSDEVDSSVLSTAVIAYPLSYADNTVTFWSDFYSGFEQYGLKDYNDLPTLPYVEEKTGIKYVFDCVSESAATEQFQLMIAAGEYDDVMMINDYYTGGLGQAYEDEVIIDLTDLLPDHAPDYWNYIQAANQTTVDTVTTDKIHLQMCSLRDAVYSDMGYVYRLDWAQELGYEFGDCITTEEFTEFLYAVQEKYGPEYTLYVTDSGATPAIGAFQTSNLTLDNANTVPMYLTDGEVVCALQDDAYRDWLTWFNQLYTDGIIDSEFYVTDFGVAELYGAIGENRMGVWNGTADAINKPRDYTDDPNLSCGAVPVFVDEDGENKFGSETAYANNKGFQVTVDCEDPGMVLEFFNWFSTEEGYMFANYGTEGETYFINENGIVEFTDLIMNNPEIPEYMMSMQIYCFTKAPALEIQSKLWGLYDIESVEAIKTWSIDTYTVTEKTIPTAAALTTEESNSIINEVNDVIAYAQEYTMKLMTGAIALDDAGWNEFQSGLEALNIQKIVDTYAFAYADYLAGNRQAVASSDPPAMPGGDMPPQ